MKTFEIHITGNSRIIQFCQVNNIKSLTLDLLDRSGKRLRTEYMTSIVHQFPDLRTCKDFAFGLANQIKKYRTKVLRIKIESPFYSDYEEQSLYMETHFPAAGPNLPISLNIAKNKIISTDREYNPYLYTYFRAMHKDREIELCLYDDNIKEDSDWLALWGY